MSGNEKKNQLELTCHIVPVPAFVAVNLFTDITFNHYFRQINTSNDNLQTVRNTARIRIQFGDDCIMDFMYLQLIQLQLIKGYFQH